jgi:EAL domain-containing protein (putative c-di-GMP-specific phosphodiesterase class I)
VLATRHTAIDALARLADRIIACIDQPFEIDGYEQFVTTSVGISVYPGNGGDADTLVKHADIAMYRAKDCGRNTYQFFTAALDASLRSRLSHEKSLRRALENGEFVIHYQPQIELSGGRLVGVEALVRWEHPRLGLLAPDQFVPTAEISGQIVALGDWVLDTAARQLADWQRAGHRNLHLSVNLSARQFHQTQLAATIRRTLDRYGIEPRTLELEITESVAMSDARASALILRDVGKIGVGLSLDDFGTGYSSLGYLRSFPLDSIKIDKSFVHDILTEPDDATIVRTVIAMAHSLGLEVVAEGVETDAQLAFLKREQCDRVQGFLFSRPVPAAELTALLEGCDPVRL